MRRFNTAGTCRPNEHYMVDITERLEIISKMIAKGDYFCINRGRQYGKTTTLSALQGLLEKTGHTVFSISFEGMGESSFESLNTILFKLVQEINDSILWGEVKNITETSKELLSELEKNADAAIDEVMFTRTFHKVCNAEKVVLLIDEVDQASNSISFARFLGLLRGMYLKRDKRPTFQSVILAGVYDVKNLKLKMRSEDQHQYNSPWNIAVPFDVDMSLPAHGIAGMLAEYKADHGLAFDEDFIAQMIWEYTAGYPFLVSRICQILDAEQYTWDKEGVLKAVNALLVERNTLFDNVIKKLDDYPELKQTLRRILLEGSREYYNPDEKYLQIAMMFNYITNVDGKVAVACRIMETRLYNYFLAEKKTSDMFVQGMTEQRLFVKDGIIDMPHLMERFAFHMKQTFDMDREHKFLEDTGREIFLTFLRPIINGVGNYYIEAQTRDHDRMDVVIDYLGKQYVIELKIWRGNAYNERGEEQLCRYLEYFDLHEGYLLSFCFNKTKKSGLLPPVVLKGRTLIEAVV